MANGSLPLLHYLQQLATRNAGDDSSSDRQLLDRFVRRHDQSAFTILLGRHARMVWNVCLRIVHDRHLAEDAFQATFLILVRKAGAIAQGERLGNWLYGVAWRVAKKAKAQADRRAARQREMIDMPHNDPSVPAGWNEVAAVLDEEVRRLPSKYREPLVLCYLQGLSNQEAARRLCCAEGTLSSWLTRGRERLRQQLRCRGLVVPAAVLAAFLADNAASATVPPVLLTSTLTLAQALAAAGSQTSFGLVSTAVAALTEGVLNDMGFFKMKIAAAILTAAVFLTGSGWLAQRALAHKPPETTESKTPDAAAAPGSKTDHASKFDLTPESFAEFRELIRPADNEWRHLKVKWLTDIVAARKKAAQEDKPILIFRTGGAGYNDPLGVC